MKPGPVFLDTHALLAIWNAADAHHAAAVQIVEQIVRDRVPALTSDWVLAEFLSFGVRRIARRAAVRSVLDLRASRSTTVLPATRRTWDEAFSLYQSRLDKAWSLIDCTSIVLCQKFGVRRVLTNDHHFTQAGFEILLP